MKNVTIQRDNQNGIFTSGVLTIDSGITFTCKTAEPKWQDNEVGISCVYADSYLCIWREMESHPGHFHYKLEDKHGRAGVFIHYMTLISESRACIALCDNYEPNGSDEEIDDSKATVELFEKLLLIHFFNNDVHETFTLNIVDNSNVTNLPTV
jgi:hypothetical protein